MTCFHSIQVLQCWDEYNAEMQVKLCFLSNFLLEKAKFPWDIGILDWCPVVPVLPNGEQMPL